jgi:hypothetical protein
MILGLIISGCNCALIGLGSMTAARGEGLVVGVNVDNPQRFSPTQQQAILDELQAANVHVIRAPLKPPWGGDDYRPAIDFIRRAYERGIKTDLIVELQYREGAQRRPAVEGLAHIWPSYPLSSADPARFRTLFKPLFDQLEDLGIIFVALELGNEINSPAFNGEFTIPSEGRIFGLADLMGDRKARKIAEGYRVYLQTLKMLKDIRDHSRLNRGTPILSAGLADPGPAGPRPGVEADAVAISATLAYLRYNGMDALVDAYGVHAYPWANTPVRRLNQLERDTLTECRPPELGKPCWLTEWGLPAGDRDCSDNDAPRAAMMQEILVDLRQFVRAGRLKGLVYYAWVDERYGIYRCGALTESGRLALDSRGLQ